MISTYVPGNPPLNLQSDLAGEFPVYIYIQDDKSVLFYSTSLVNLLDDARIRKPLQISNQGLSFVLQSGVVPPPKTIYRNLFVVSIGDTAQIKTVSGKVDVKFSHIFPFHNQSRHLDSDVHLSDDLILQLIAEATVSRIDQSKPSFLFHSAGKDSNSIALALAEAGWQDKVTLITHKSKGKLDESEISEEIAKKLGFKHQILHEVDKLDSQQKNSIENYFSLMPLPSIDGVSLAYPLYMLQLPELANSNIIDGGGNDSYMMTPPTRKELALFPLARIFSKFNFMRKYAKSETQFNSVLRTPAEWCGISGLSFRDALAIYPKCESVFYYWNEKSCSINDWDIFEFKTNILALVVASEMHIRKVRLFADTMRLNLILPFANESVARYFERMPEKYLFDRKNLKNKLILRKILKERMALDSDRIGKMGFSYDKSSVINQNWGWIKEQIFNCSLWNDEGIQKVISHLKHVSEGCDRNASVSAGLINRIFLLSLWYNKNKYTAW